jgi:hypothetical protein
VTSGVSEIVSARMSVSALQSLGDVGLMTKHIRMISESEIDRKNPGLTDVFGAMKIVASGEREPLVLLKYEELVPASDAIYPASELWIARLNDPDSGEFAGWLVRHKEMQLSKSSHVLAVSMPTSGAFLRLELFGAKNKKNKMGQVSLHAG